MNVSDFGEYVHVFNRVKNIFAQALISVGHLLI